MLLIRAKSIEWPRHYPPCLFAIRFALRCRDRRDGDIRAKPSRSRD
jgi:hypothetical protein